MFKKLIPTALISLALIGCTESQSIEESPNDITTYELEVFVNDVSMGKADIHAFEDSQYQTITANNKEHKALSIAQIIQKKSNTPDEALDAYLAGYMCDYESADGFRSSSKGDRCPNVSCTLAIHSFIDTQTHALFYTDDQPMAPLGCYNVTDLKKILMYPVE